MKPTAKLRLIERTIPTPEFGENTGVIVRILQQWWDKDIADQYTAAIAGEPSGEWRDVPLENEQ